MRFFGSPTLTTTHHDLLDFILGLLMADSDSEDEEFCLFGMKGPIVVCGEDEVQEPVVADLRLTALQHLELSFLRKDERALKAMLLQDGISGERHCCVQMALSLLQGKYTALIMSSDVALPFGKLCKLCNSYESSLEVPESLRKLVFRFIAGGVGEDDRGDEAVWRAFQVQLLGYAYFSLFCQVNYTGPALDREDMVMLSAAAADDDECVTDCGDSNSPFIDNALGAISTAPAPGPALGELVPQYPCAPASCEHSVDSSRLNNKTILRLLECDGNYAFPLTELPVLLVLARCLLLPLACPLRAGWQAGVVLSGSGEVLAARNEDLFDVKVVKAVRALCSRQWTSGRALMIHLRLLQKQSYSDNSTLFKEMQDVFAEAESELATVVHKEPPSELRAVLEEEGGVKEGEGGVVENNAQLLAVLQLERGLAAHFFDHGDKGKARFQEAIRTLGLRVHLTAALGKRTKYQVHDHAQLLLLAQSSLLPASCDYNLTRALADAASAMEKCFGRKKEQSETPLSNVWEHSEWELGTRIVTTSEEQGGAEVAIRDVPLDAADGGAAENILLEEGVKFTAPPEGSSGGADLDARHNVLHPLEQALLLALCLDVGNSNASGDELTTEEMFPYLQSVLNMYHNHQHLLECSHKVEKKNEMLIYHSMGRAVHSIDFKYDGEAVAQCLNWMVYSTTLMERSFLEFEKRRTMDRALMQLQALLDQHSTRLSVFQSSRQEVVRAAPAHVRLQLLPCLAYPAQYEVKRDLAQRYLRCQVFNSALNLFTELEMWDEVVTCYQLLQKPHRAERLVRARLEQGEETPYMVCALADLTQSEELYERAWVLSGKRYARAKRTVARMCFEQGRFQECCDHLDAALRVQPLVADSWYLKGIACMRIQNYSGATEAFTRCVQQDMEIGEAWGNLGAIHMHCKRYDRAYECLLEAQKHRSREWRLTENLLTVCIETGRYAESLQFMRQLLELRHHRSNAIEKQSVTNNSFDANTTQDHPTPVHIPDLRRLCVVVALRTVKFVRALDAAAAAAGQSQGQGQGGDVSATVPGSAIVLPRLTTDLEEFLSKILSVMHVDAVYFELLVLYHDLIFSGGGGLAEEGAAEGGGNLENRATTTVPTAGCVGAAELWARRRSKDAIRTFRLKQFRVLLSQPGWEKDDARVAEVFRVIQCAIDCCCCAQEAPLLLKKDFYGLRSMLRTAHSRLESFYRDSRQLEGPAAAARGAELSLLSAHMALCTDREDACAK